MFEQALVAYQSLENKDTLLLFAQAYKQKLLSLSPSEKNSLLEFVFSFIKENQVLRLVELEKAVFFNTETMESIVPAIIFDDVLKEFPAFSQLKSARNTFIKNIIATDKISEVHAGYVYDWFFTQLLICHLLQFDRTKYFHELIEDYYHHTKNERSSSNIINKLQLENFTKKGTPQTGFSPSSLYAFNVSQRNKKK